MEKNNRKKLILKLLFILIIIFIIFAFSILKFQKDAFFHPWHDEESYNILQMNTSFKEINIDNNGKLLNGWLKINSNQSPAPLLIFFGGNAQNSSNTCATFIYNDTYKYFENYNLIIIDYPGYGLSEGNPSDTSMFEAGLKIYDYACNLEYVDINNIIILGYSIGTGTATYVASQRNVNGLILIAPYDEALNLYNDNLNIFHGPLKLLAMYKFRSIEYAPNVNVSPLIITSYNDEVINYNHSLNLAKYFKNIENLIILENVTHNNYFSQETVLENIQNYLKEKLITQ